MHRGLYIAVIAALSLFGGAGSASAHTTIIEPPGSHYPFQQWSNEMRVLSPSEPVTVTEVADPCEVQGAEGCQLGRAIQIKPFSGDARGVLYHEIGHIWDEEEMQEWQREHFETLIHQAGAFWYEQYSPGAFSVGESAPNEWFADAYSLCAEMRHVAVRTIYNVADGVMGGKALRATCRMIGRTRF